MHALWDRAITTSLRVILRKVEYATMNDVRSGFVLIALLRCCAAGTLLFSENAIVGTPFTLKSDDTKENKAAITE